MTTKERVVEALKALGKDCTYDEARDWVFKKYNARDFHNSTFYTTRRNYRLKLSQEREIPPPTVVHEEKVTLEEVLRLREFVNSFGGLDRVKATLKVWEELQA